MVKRLWLIIILFGVAPAWAQAPGIATGTSAMVIPPPVSGEPYPTEGSSLARSNYLSGGLIFNTAYTDNLLGGTSQKPISDISYSVWPKIALDEDTSRLHTLLTYSPGFTFYQRTSSYNQDNQNVAIDFSYRLSPHVALTLRDSLQKTSNIFNQPDLLAATPVSGSTQAPAVAVVAPVADQLGNTSNALLTYQFSRNDMVGAAGTFSNLHYIDPNQVPGLFDSNSSGGLAFYTHRLSREQYIGATYQYARILAYPTDAVSETQSNSILVFYTVYFKPTFSLSFSGGPQHYDVGLPLLPEFQAWCPSGSASLGWQGRHTAFSAGYSRAVTAGGGLVGAFNSNSATLSARQQLTRQWRAGLSGGYSIYKTLDPLLSLANPGGHTVSGSASIKYDLDAHMYVELGYTRLHQSYGSVAAVSAFPNVNREWISISYQFTRPLGR